ncbi:MAG: HD domain-containing protein [Pirellula sp.]|jgi:hypothetical protein|nr:HD domain-containing protein [Pirellula sp.]
MQDERLNSAEAIERSLRLAVQHHAGQRDKAGECYLLHLLRVMFACKSSESMQAGLLHDVLEDTDATAETLRSAGLAVEVVEAVELLTRTEGMPYGEYILRLAENPIAKEAKIADLWDNYRLDRVAYRSDHCEEDRHRIQQYILAYQFLQGKLSRSVFLERMASIA